MTGFGWLLYVAFSAEHVVVHTGDTIESIAQQYAGMDPLALRAANGLSADEQPRPGTILHVPSPPEAGEDAAVVLSVFGGGSVQLPTGETADLAPSLRLAAGAQVCTQEGAYATIRLSVAENNVHDDITLLPGTCLSIRSTTRNAPQRSSLLTLEQGSVTVPRAETGASNGTITIETKSGVTSAESGGFRVHVEQDAARTEALYTPLRVFGAGVEQALLAGQGSRTRTGEAPLPPVALPPSGQLIAPIDGATLRRPDFSWTRSETALAYQLELARSEDFRDMLLGMPVDRPSWEPDRLMLPSNVEGLWWRVATVDRHGFVGIPTQSWRLELPVGVGP